MSHETEIRIPNGKITCKAVSEVLKKTKCYKCQKDIYIVYTTFGPKIPVSKVGDSLVLHDLDCPHSQLAKEDRKKAEAQKRYEENIIKRDRSKSFRKKRHG